MTEDKAFPAPLPRTGQPAEPDVRADEQAEAPPLRWFHATLHGDYVGEPANRAKAAGRRHRPRIYRARVEDLTWLPEPPAPNAEADLWQAQIDEARVAHVLGPGTMYEGPIFEVQLREVQLSAATTHRGRAYGRIRAQVTCALVMPEKPAIPAVKVTLPGAPVRAPKQAPLAAKISQSGAAEPPPGAVMAHDSQRRAVGMRGLLLLVASIVLGLCLHGGWLHGVFFALFALPTLLLRWMFGELLQPSRFTRVATALCSLASLAFVLFAVHLVRTCAPHWWWPALAILALLWPACLLPSALPTAVSLGSWGLMVALLSSHAHHCGTATSAQAPALVRFLLEHPTEANSPAESLVLTRVGQSLGADAPSGH